MAEYKKFFCDICGDSCLEKDLNILKLNKKSEESTGIFHLYKQICKECEIDIKTKIKEIHDFNFQNSELDKLQKLLKSFKGE